MAYRYTLHGHQLPRTPPPQNWIFPAELRDALPKSFRSYFESIDNAGPEFTTYMRMYQYDDVVPKTTLTGLLCSYLVMERNCTAVTYALHNLNEEEVERAGGKEGVQKIYAAFRQIVGGFAPYRGALGEIQWKGVEGATSEKKEHDPESIRASDIIDAETKSCISSS